MNWLGTADSPLRLPRASTLYSPSCGSTSRTNASPTCGSDYGSRRLFAAQRGPAESVEANIATVYIKALGQGAHMLRRSRLCVVQMCSCRLTLEHLLFGYEEQASSMVTPVSSRSHLPGSSLARRLRKVPYRGHAGAAVLG